MANRTHGPTDAGDDLTVIGRGIGPVGRWLRLLFGLYFLVFLVLNPLYLYPVPAEQLGSFALVVGGYILLIAVVYLGAFHFIGEPILSRMNPWFGTVIFLGIPTVLDMTSWLPQAAQLAFWLYVSGSLILVFFMRYGGCEVVALPSLLLRRRYTVYCPFNALDAVERAVRPDGRSQRAPLLSLLSIALVLLVGGYFLLIEMQVLGHDGMAPDIDRRWSLLLLLPVAHLVAMALGHYRHEQTLFAASVRRFGLGAMVRALANVAFLFADVTGYHLWMGAMALGGTFALFHLGAVVVRRLRPSPPR